jgi:hypothetical protein
MTIIEARVGIRPGQGGTFMIRGRNDSHDDLQGALHGV